MASACANPISLAFATADPCTNQITLYLKMVMHVLGSVLRCPRNFLSEAESLISDSGLRIVLFGSSGVI